MSIAHLGCNVARERVRSCWRLPVLKRGETREVRESHRNEHLTSHVSRQRILRHLDSPQDPRPTDNTGASCLQGGTHNGYHLDEEEEVSQGVPLPAAHNAVTPPPCCGALPGRSAHLRAALFSNILRLVKQLQGYNGIGDAAYKTVQDSFCTVERRARADLVPSHGDPRG